MPPSAKSTTTVKRKNMWERTRILPNAHYFSEFACANFLLSIKLSNCHFTQHKNQQLALNFAIGIKLANRHFTRPFKSEVFMTKFLPHKRENNTATRLNLTPFYCWTERKQHNKHTHTHTHNEEKTKTADKASIFNT